MTPHDVANILLVDDHPANLLVLEQMLAPLGQNLVRAESGEAALRELLHGDFALILLDVCMPGMDGFETARRVKEREQTRYIPIIFLTAISNEPRQTMEGYSAGAVDYLSKPFAPWLLTSKVRVFLELHFERIRAERLSQELAVAEVRRRHAFELNDDIVQGLAVAKYALDLGDQTTVRKAIDDTLQAAQRIVSDLLLPDGDLSLGELTRSAAPRNGRRRGRRAGAA